MSPVRIIKQETCSHFHAPHHALGLRRLESSPQLSDDLLLCATIYVLHEQGGGGNSSLFFLSC